MSSNEAVGAIGSNPPAVAGTLTATEPMFFHGARRGPTGGVAAPRMFASRPIAWALASLLGSVALLGPAFAQAASDPGFAKLEGKWSCSGHFIANARAISSEIDFTRDPVSGALIVRHDDIAPAAYHALEVWASAGPGPALRAAIVDSYSGMRWFESPGWIGTTLVWTRFDGANAAERFAYTLGDPRKLTIGWSVARAGGAMTLGDTLACAPMAGRS